MHVSLKSKNEMCCGGAAVIKIMKMYCVRPLFAFSIWPLYLQLLVQRYMDMV